VRHSLACTNIIENMMGTIRCVCRNAKRWQDASVALRWASAAMLKAAKASAGSKPASNLAQAKHDANSVLEPAAKAA
jgi:hypothetical protein